MSNGILSAIAFPGAVTTWVGGINDLGTIVGSYDTLSASGLDIGNGFIMNQQGLFTLNFPGATETNLEGINNEGDIAGNYVDSDGVPHGFIATPTAVPEPAFPALLASGLLLVAGLRRRR